MTGLFSPDATQKHVDAMLANLPPTANRIILGYARTDGTVKVVYAERLSKAWSAAAVLSHAPKAHWTGEVCIKGVW